MSLILNGTTGLSNVDGTAAAPAISGTDTNTGIFFPAADTIAFAEGGAEAMRLTSTGSLCFGSTAAGDAGTINLSVGLAGTTPGGLQLWAGSTQEHYIQWGDSTSGAATCSGAISYTHASDAMKFFTVSTERARIDSSGNFFVGTTSHLYANTSRANIKAVASSYGATISSLTAGYQSLTLLNEATSGTRSFVQFSLNANGSTDVGSITSTGTTTVYGTTSDYRLKENIAPMTGALAKVAQLKPVTYKWKSDGSDSQGFIAHELQAVVPECVTREKDAVDADGKPQYQGIDTSFLVATLTAALQEAHELIKNLEQRVAALEAV